MKKIRVVTRQCGVPEAVATTSSQTLIGQIRWSVVGKVIRLCVRIAETVQRAIIASTRSALTNALNSLVRHGRITQAQADEVWRELQHSEGSDWVPTR